MSGREFKPGDVIGVPLARGVVRGVIAADRGAFSEEGERWRPEVVRAFADVRHFVVIDPEDREQVERLDDIYQAVLDAAPAFHGLADVMQAALREFANPAPPKPDEPTGQYAVVEDSEALEWVLADPLHTPAPWKCLTLDVWRNYADIDVAHVHHQGVTP